MGLVTLMQKLGFLSDMGLKYFNQHGVTLQAMEWTYELHNPQIYDGDVAVKSLLSINPQGNIYKVIQSYHVNGETHVDVSLATYGWHSNGHLMEIGGYRVWIFDPQNRTLYLENYDEEKDTKTVQIYIKIEH